MRTWLAVIVPSALLLAASPAEEFSIKLKRDGEVGEKLRISGLATEKTDMVMKVAGMEVPAPPGSNENKRFKILGDFELVAKDADGDPSEFKGVISKLVAFGADGTQTVLLEEGSDLSIVYEGGEPTFECGGEGVSEGAAEALGEFFDDRNEDEIDTDAVFGTAEKKKVGDSWPINAEAASKGLGEGGMQIPADKIKGEFTLHGIVERDGVRCLDIRGEMLLMEMKMPLPPGVTVTESEGKLTFSGLFPIDEKASALEENMSMLFRIKASGTVEGQAFEMDMHAAQSKNGTMRPLE